MQWNLVRTGSQLANRTCLTGHRAGSFWFCQSEKGHSVLDGAGRRLVWVHGPQSRRLHGAAALYISKEKKPLEAHPSQPDISQQKQQEEAISKGRPDLPLNKTRGASKDAGEELDPLQDKSISLFQRFKKTFRQYGKVMIPVHLLTSTVWFGTFYYAAMKGVNVVPFLELIGLPDSVVNILKNSQSGNALTAYAMYKIATPARYTVTLGGTSITVKYLRSRGYMSTPPPVKEYLQDRMEETKDLITEKMEETKDRLTGKLQETKDKVSFKKKVE
ncbi:protein FAM210A [Tachyglossus aculeatus]|uniref:protein FAM210A n=1 Tax=Tachyglossus aculeatus TaxID=9261 RepID=UPI0018F72698|nr:protein FAM210A [Tachyglossus aculeatus]XP_038602256.1 protein FAM210A [Tachyglossus aculeatus]XP_038602258.1 protein FAM210A [Tachyglossus aculeatus]